MTAGGRLAFVLALGAACTPARVFRCGGDEVCVRGAEGGRCLEGGCAFGDSACESGLRWVDESPVWPGQCVGADLPIPDARPDSTAGLFDAPPESCLRAVQVSAGAQHACLVSPGGRVFCWGDNSGGQLGLVAAGGPTPVESIAGGAVAVAAGAGHTCALLADGGVTCWGQNDNGQLGRGGTSGPELPGPRAIASGATAVAAGYAHSCAVQGGIVLCWGENFDDQSDPDDLRWEVPAPQSPGIIDLAGDRVALGGIHSVSIDGGFVTTWGSSDEPQLGRGEGAIEDPIVVAGTYEAVAAGWAHTCAIQTSGMMSCWGYGGGGRLGVGGDQYFPASFSLPERPTQVTAGERHSCALAGDAGENLYCWGDNLIGQLGVNGLGGTTPRLAHDEIAWVAASAGRAFTCGIDGGGRVRCFGANQAGQLGRSGPPGSDADPIEGSCP